MSDVNASLSLYDIYKHVYCLSQESRYTKMEKADILEMTVAHLKFVHSARQSASYGDAVAGRGAAGCRSPVVVASLAAADETSGGDGAAALRYLMGYNECVREVASYLAGDDGETGGRLGDGVRIALMRHLDETLRLRAAEPLVRLPSPDVPGDRFDPAAAASSPPDSVPWRSRCDSGVYSGASSPAQADELARAASPPSPLELTTTTTREQSFPVPPSPLTPDVSAPSDVWRPW